MKNRYMPTALLLYLSYVIGGTTSVLIAQNMDYLSLQLHTDNAGVAYVLSGIGIGRLAVLLISGILSDKFGRKPFVFIALGLFIVSYVGILVSPNVAIGFICAVIAGMANSCLDVGSYPALMEAFPSAPGTATILIKAFISGGSFVFPFVTGFIIANNIYWGWSFIFFIVYLFVLGVALLRMPFPNHKIEASDSSAEDATVAAEKRFLSKPNIWIEGVCLIMIGYTSTATFYVVSIWMPKFGAQVAGMDYSVALRLISYYSIGSLISVIITGWMVKALYRQVTFVFVYPLISTICLVLMYCYPTPILCKVASFIIGFTAAGGVLQLALTTMAEFFPRGKGKITGLVYTLSSLATFSTPLITGYLSKTVIADIILFNAVVDACGVIFALIVMFRYKTVFGKTYRFAKKAVSSAPEVSVAAVGAE
ncbi:membrane protein, major facilitator superfamily [Syntrophotalea carbinolica DSM 2380]|uniref:Membrane protein, major facilitator superfamily n=1 Tax=Syntrophotalea carbinolica (strain DSM 2380 / NBRC 103641 / GraBd1) TaxID=338963 RepID=Q3A2I4_SYNC1|nr:MFS transporter [Syntrophotalea carbinolica]ABA89423.1 membrane protein, major facilitator superfamily [Syntrophotalea carbinolica DSM 2380]